MSVQGPPPSPLSHKQEIDQAIEALKRSLVPYRWNSLSDQQQATEQALESLRTVLHRHEEILSVLYPEHEPPDVG